MGLLGGILKSARTPTPARPDASPGSGQRQGGTRRFSSASNGAGKVADRGSPGGEPPVASEVTRTPEEREGVESTDANAAAGETVEMAAVPAPSKIDSSKVDTGVATGANSQAERATDADDTTWDRPLGPDAKGAGAATPSLPPSSRPSAPTSNVPTTPLPLDDLEPPEPPSPPAPGGVVVMPAELMRDLFRDASGAPASGKAGKPSKKRTALLLGVGGLIGSLVFALVNFFIVPTILKGEPAKPVGIDDALAEFRAEGGTGDDSGAYGSDQAAAGDPSASGATAATDPTTVDSGTSTSAGESSGSGGGAPSGSAQGSSQAAPLLRPPAGVYSFSASGSESTKPGSLSAETNTIGPTVVAVVRHGSGNCWTLEFMFNSKHTSSDTFCAGPGSLTATDGVADSTSYGQKVHNVVKCNPPIARVTPGMAPGSSSQGSCTLTTSGAASSTSTSKETWTYVGNDTVLGAPAWHIKGQTQSSGGSVGTTTQDVWISQSNGMVVKFSRKVSMTSQAPVIGNVVYNEQIEGTLKSLTPQT